MSTGPKRGRPPISDFCVDCFKEGLSRPDAGEKVYGSYCSRHFYKRQRATQIKRSYRKVVIWGQWSTIPENALEHLVEMCTDNIGKIMSENDAYGDEVQVALHRPRAVSFAFEYDCVRNAIGLNQRLTIAEEDLIIEAHGGARDGYDALSIVAGEHLTVPSGPVMLPNPKVRLLFRSDAKGGPTTVGEPSYTTYYEQRFGTQPPADLREEVDRDEVALDSDGKPMMLNGDAVTRGFLEELRRRGLSIDDFRKTKEPRQTENVYEGDPEDMVEDPISHGLTKRKNLVGYIPPEDGTDYFNRMNESP